MKRKPKHKAAKTTAGQLQSPTARLKLPAQTRPYFVKIARGAWVGYRKPLSGPGSWAARVGFSDGKGWEKTLWGADDNGLKADGDKVLSFWQAKDRSAEAGRTQARCQHHDGGRRRRTGHARRGADAIRRRASGTWRAGLQRAAGAPHLSDTLLSKPLSLITEAELRVWRGDLLTKGLAPSSVNRTMNTVRAALTLADKTRVHIWRGGLKALPDATEANNVVIEDEAKAQAMGRGKLRPRSPARVVDACARRERHATVAGGAAAGPRPDHHRSEGTAPDDAEERQRRHGIRDSARSSATPCRSRRSWRRC